MIVLGVDFASESNFPGDQSGAVLLERQDDGSVHVVDSWVGADSVLRELTVAEIRESWRLAEKIAPLRRESGEEKC